MFKKCKNLAKVRKEVQYVFSDRRGESLAGWPENKNTEKYTGPSGSDTGQEAEQSVEFFAYLLPRQNIPPTGSIVFVNIAFCDFS